MTCRSFLTGIALLLCISGFSQQIVLNWSAYFEKIDVADSLYHRGEYLASAKAYSYAFDCNNQGFTVGHKYKAARAWAMAGQKDSAIANLVKDIEAGYYQYDVFISEKAFASLHALPEWGRLKQKLYANKEAEDRRLGPYKEVKSLLEDIHVRDQQYRTEYMVMWQKHGFVSEEMKSLIQKMQEQDRQNLEEVSRIIDRYGWLGYDTIGYKANQTLFLVIQHADSATQEKYLPVLQQAVLNKKAMPYDLALLTDRVYLKRGLKQVYGSQVECDTTGKKCWVLPIEDEINVDKRRAEVGLQPLEEYVKTWGIVYKKPE